MLILWLATAWPATCSSQAIEPLRIESSLEAMGSTYTIVAYGTDRFRMEAAVEESFDEIRRLDALLSNYRERSEWSRVNREAGDRPVIGSMFGIQPENRGSVRHHRGASGPGLGLL
jgi:thiamine biosynthesis lipoprotein ApbE